MTTRWTRVCLAKADSEDGRVALADLCAAYYEPVLAFLRSALRDADAARDLGHAFFEEILRGGRIEAADPERGRFRSYLLGAVKHFLARHRESERRLKRGGGLAPVPLEEVYLDDAALAPDAAFDRQWAVTTIARGMEALRRECREAGREAFFESVGGILSGQAIHGDQIRLAEEWGMSGDAFRMAVGRLRRRLRQCIKAEVAGTLADPAAAQAEMEALYTALGR